jgi:hypothetical protein
VVIWEFIKAMFEEVGRAANTPKLLMSPADEVMLILPIIFFMAVVVALVFIYDKIRTRIRYGHW